VTMMAGRCRVMCLLGLALLSHGCLQKSSAQRQSAATDSQLDDEVVKGPIGARLDEYLSRATAFGFTGTALVAIGETPILHKGYSLADRATRKPNTSRTIYDIGSITKTLTAMGILLLESQGKLSVEDKIGRFLSGVPGDKQEIRLRHLLTQRH
jgi:CubicO group peptidase (beta-lactamase class C family)